MVKTKKYLKKNKRKTRRGGYVFLDILGLKKKKKINHLPIHITDTDNDFSFYPITPNDLSIPRYVININTEGINKLYLKDNISNIVTALKNGKHNMMRHRDISLTKNNNTIFMSGTFKFNHAQVISGNWEVEEIFPITLSLEKEQYRPLNVCFTKLEYETNAKFLNNTLYGPDTLYEKDEYKFINLINEKDSEHLPNVSNDDILYKAIQLLYRFLKTKYDLYPTKEDNPNKENNFLFKNISLENFSEEDTYVRIKYNVSDIIEFKLEPNMEESVLECYYIHNDNLFIIVGI
jgi:hypothetical protein